MHELSIAQAVLQITLDHAHGRRVEKVELRIGHLRQVVPSALEFSWELVADGTDAAGAELVIEHVPARGHCPACEKESVMSAFPLRCDSCGGLDIDIVAGEELLVDAIELGEETEVAREGIAHGC